MRAIGGVVIAILAACGSGDGDDGDPVTVRISYDGEPASGIDVVFHAEDGLPLSHVVTDATGIATGTVGARGQVSIARLDSEGDAFVVTYRSIEPGDEIVYELAHSVFDPGPILGSITVTGPSPLIPGAGFGFIHSGCETVNADGAVFQIRPECVNEDTQTFPVYAVAMDAPDPNAAVAWTMDPAIPVSATSAALPPDWIWDFDTATYGPGAIPEPHNGGLSAAFRIGDVAFAGAHDATAHTLRFPRSAAVTSWLAYLHIAYNDAPDEVQAEAAISTTTLPSSFTADFAAELMPKTFTGPRLDTSVPDRPVFSWSGNASADVITASMFWDRGGVSYAWSVIDAATAPGPLVVPVLPPELASYAPAIDSDYTDALVSYLEMDWADGYRDALRHAGITSGGSSDYQMRRTGVFIPVP
jgi:hypothetical protein